MCDIQFSTVTSVITAAGLIVYGSKENKAILRHLALIHRKVASSLFLKHESPFAGCGVWRVAEVKGAGDCSVAGGRAPTGPGGERQLFTPSALAWSRNYRVGTAPRVMSLPSAWGGRFFLELGKTHVHFELLRVYV